MEVSFPPAVPFTQLHHNSPHISETCYTSGFFLKPPCGYCPLDLFAFDCSLYLAHWKFRVSILPSGFFVFSLLAVEVTILNEVKRLNSGFRSRKLLSYSFLCKSMGSQSRELWH